MKAATVVTFLLRFAILVTFLAPAVAAAQSCVTAAEPCALRNEAHPPWTTNSVGMKLLLVAPPNGGDSHPFYIGARTVAGSSFNEVMGRSGNPGDRRSTVTVSAEEAIEFCRRLSIRTGKTYRLPDPRELTLAPPGSGTDAEWVMDEQGGVVRTGAGDDGNTASFRVVRVIG